MKTADKWNRYNSNTQVASWLMRSYVLLGLIFIYVWSILPGNMDLQGFPLKYWKFIPSPYWRYLWMDGFQYALGALVFNIYARYDERMEAESNHYYGVLICDFWFAAKVLLFSYIILGG